MIIEEKDFRLTPVKECGNLFDLEILKIINKGKDNERSEFKIIAYGIKLESALQYVANHRIADKYTDIIDLKTYLKEYKNIIAELKQLCN